MDLDEFKSAVHREFGANLEHATPANVREFLDKMQIDSQGGGRPRIVLNETKTTYEAILRDFFARVLEFPRDDALILLWTLAFELSFTTLEHHLADQLDPLFRDLDQA